jgi:hypothetical protein
VTDLDVGGPALLVESWEPSGEPSSADTRPHRAITLFDFSDLPVMQLWLATSGDGTDLVRIEGIRGSNSLSFIQVCPIHLHGPATADRKDGRGQPGLAARSNRNDPAAGPHRTRRADCAEGDSSHTRHQDAAEDT